MSETPRDEQDQQEGLDSDGRWIADRTASRRLNVLGSGDPVEPSDPDRYAEAFERRFSPSGKVAHIVQVDGGPYEALCGRAPEAEDPEAPESWLGTGDQDEHDKAAALPLCQSCDKRMRAVLTRLRAIAARRVS